MNCAATTIKTFTGRVYKEADQKRLSRPHGSTRSGCNVHFLWVKRPSADKGSLARIYRHHQDSLARSDTPQAAAGPGRRSKFNLRLLCHGAQTGCTKTTKRGNHSWAAAPLFMCKSSHRSGRHHSAAAPPSSSAGNGTDGVIVEHRGTLSWARGIIARRIIMTAVTCRSVVPRVFCTGWVIPL